MLNNLLKYRIAVGKGHVMSLSNVARRDRKWILIAPEVVSFNKVKTKVEIKTVLARNSRLYDEVYAAEHFVIL